MLPKDRLPSSLQELAIIERLAIKSLPKDDLPISLRRLEVFGDIIQGYRHLLGPLLDLYILLAYHCRSNSLCIQAHFTEKLSMQAPATELSLHSDTVRRPWLWVLSPLCTLRDLSWSLTF